MCRNSLASRICLEQPCNYHHISKTIRKYSQINTPQPNGAPIFGQNSDQHFLALVQTLDTRLKNMEISQCGNMHQQYPAPVQPMMNSQGSYYPPAHITQQQYPQMNFIPSYANVTKNMYPSRAQPSSGNSFHSIPTKAWAPTSTQPNQQQGMNQSFAAQTFVQNPLNGDARPTPQAFHHQTS